ncbi:MAG: phenylacetic acid degradation operon negative regulatory protein PaaX [Candidatus Odyssella sp.]|nr:phenylacetic acid degradation operon negative regulatory protein PaaX [Candidatus Odyssella sp.]
MDESRRLKPLVAALPRRLKPRAKSLLVTVWGDAVAPHGAGIWLGSLIRLVAPLGLNERLVRTSVLRLTREGWFAVAREGRRSYYGLTDFGHKALVADPPRRIYAATPTPWDGLWRFVLTNLGGDDRIDRDTRLQLRRELTWLGFGAVAPGVFAHPSPDRAGVERVLAKLGVADRVEIMAATPERPRGLLQSCWDLEALRAAYRRFIERFRPLWQALEKAPDPEPETCFVLRVLLIHEYRRIILRDPELPAELLSADWAGGSARVLCRNLYRRVAAAAERHVTAVLETADGPLPEPRPYYFQRFGGLAEPDAHTQPRPDTREKTP